MAGLKFRVLIDSADKEVFRDILISDGDHFESLYREIMRSFDFKGAEMASFYVSNVNWDKGQEIALFDMGIGEEEEEVPLVMKESIIRTHISDPNQRIILVHDFIRMWIFLIELIEVVKESPASAKTILSVGDAPLESSRTGNEDIQFNAEDIEDEDEDDFGFDDFEEGYNEDDFDLYE